MGNNTNSLPIDTPSTYEVQKAVSQLTDRDLGFAKEKNQYHTEIDLANQEKEITLATIEENTKNDSDDLAESSDNEYQDILHNLPNGLQDIDKQLRFTARRGKTKEIRQIAREYRKEFVKDMKYTCRTLGIYFRKVRNGRFDENMITPAQMQILNAKVQAWHDKIKGFIGDTLTGDNVLAERSNKKDNFVGPDVNVKTDGVEWRGTYTSEQANAMANGCCQPQTAERKKKYYGMIDKNVNIPILSNTGNQVLRSGMKILPDIVRLGVGIKYGIDTIKGIFGLFSADGRKPDALRKLTKSASILGLVAFTDIDKAVNYVGGWFSNATKNYSSNRISSIGSNKEIIEGLGNLKAGESLPYGYGETLMGKAFAVPGVTIGEINQEQIISYNGNRPIGMNFSRLKKMYSEKMNNNQADIPKYTEAINNVNDLEKAYNQLKTKEQREAFMDTMTAVGISKEVLENTAIADKPIALFMASTMKTAEILPELGQRLVITDKIMSNKEVESYISTYGKEKFIDEVMKLPDSIRLGIEKGEILFTIENGKLIMKAYNQDILLDITTGKLSANGKNGVLEHPAHFSSVSDLLMGGSLIAKTINSHKDNYMIQYPFFYKQGLGERGNDMSVSKGKKAWRNPFTWLHGKNSEIIDGGWYTSLDKTCPTIYNNMELHTNYMNKLDIRKNPQADQHINDSLLPQLKSQYPGLTDVEYANMIKVYFGLYATRGNIDALAYQNRHAIKDPFIKFVGDNYRNTKDFIKPHYNTIKERTTERTEKGWDKIKDNATDIYNDAGDFKIRIAKKRDNRDQVLKGLVKESGIAIDKIENLAFNQLPKGIGNLIANIILGAGKIVSHGWNGVADGIRESNKDTNTTSTNKGSDKTSNTNTTTKNTNTKNTSSSRDTKNNTSSKKNPRDNR